MTTEPKAKILNSAKPYTVGYGKPPKATQFKPGQSGNPKGRSKGQPTLAEILLEEVARLVKVKIGDEIVQISKQQALMRKLLDLALQGNIPAARLVLQLTETAYQTAEAAPPPELPLTPEELAIVEILAKQPGGS